MTIRLRTPAREGSTYVLQLTLTDPLTGDPVTLASGTWTLRDHNEVVVSAAQNLPSLISPIILPVPGASLMPPSNAAPVQYRITIQGTYNAIYGNNQPYTEEIIFLVEPLVGVGA